MEPFHSLFIVFYLFFFFLANVDICYIQERITTEDDVSEYEEHKAESKEQENFLPEEGVIEVKKELEEKEQDTASKKEKATLIKKNPAPKIITEKQQTGTSFLS